MNSVIELMLLWLVAQAAMTDLATRRIPNVLVLCGLVIALTLHALAGGKAAVAHTWFTGFAAGFLIFLPLYVLRGMAAGDVKLMAMVGAFAGPEDAIRIALLACLVGGVLGLVMVAWSGRWRLLLRNLGIVLRPLLERLAGYRVDAAPLSRADSAGGIPYGLAIAIGTAVVVLHGPGAAFA